MHAQAHEVCLVSIPSLQLKMDPTKKLMDKIYCYCTPLRQYPGAHIHTRLTV